MTITLRYQRSAADQRRRLRPASTPRCPAACARRPTRCLSTTFHDELCVQLGTAAARQLAVHRRRAPATRLGPQARNYQATLAVGDRISTSTAAACGPVAALTAMLYDRGIAVEMTAFHQVPSGEHTATFIRGTDGARRRMGDGLVRRPDAVGAARGHRLREPASDRRLISALVSAAGAARSACRPSAPACRRSPSAACSRAGAARAGTGAAAGA